jgi:hypothetical protein
MKKLLFVLAIGAFAACNDNTETSTTTTDSVPAATVDTASVAPVDTAATAVDTTAAKVDSAAKK